MDKKLYTRYVVTGALIAAAYAGLTFLSGFFGLAYGPLQFRLSEALTILPVFSAAAIPGLAVGCFIANIASFNLIDMIFGTAATLIAAWLTYCLRNIKFRGLPLMSFLPPVLVNALIVGFEIAVFWTDGGATSIGFAAAALEIVLSETVICAGLGIPLYLAVKKYRVFPAEK